MRHSLRDITGLEFAVGDTVVTGMRQGSGSGSLLVRKVVDINDNKVVVRGVGKTSRPTVLVVEALILNDMDPGRLTKAEEHG